MCGSELFWDIVCECEEDDDVFGFVWLLVYGGY